MSVFGFIGLSILVCYVAMAVVMPLAALLSDGVIGVIPELLTVGLYVGVVAGVAVWALERWIS